MNELLTSAQAWWLGTAVGGSIVLLLACWFAKRANAPLAMQRFGEFGIIAALLVAVLRLGPTWWEVTDPRPAPPAPPKVVVAPKPQIPLIPPVDVAWMPGTATPEVVRDVPPMFRQLPEPTSVSMPAEFTNSVVTPLNSPGSLTPSLADSLLLAYAAVAGLLVLRWLLGQWALARMIRYGRAAPEQVQQIFDRIAMQIGQTDARLVVSHRVPVPMCCGLRTPTVLIPRSLVLRNDPAVWRWIFAHELTHLARRDPWTTWTMGLAQALYFFVPWFWWLKRQVRLCQEYVADAAAAAQGPWAEEYAQFLVSLAHCPAAPQGATGVVEKTSDLYRRVTMLLQPKTGGPSSRRQLVSGIACLMASAVVFAGLGVRAATPGEDKKDEAKADVIVEVIGVDGDKADGDKDGEKKADVKKRVIMGQGMGGIDKAEIEKKLRKALEKAKLSDEEVDKIVKEVTKSLEGVKMKFDMAPLAGQHIAGDALKHLELLKEQPGGLTVIGGDGAPMVWSTAPGGRWAGWPAQGRLGIVADKPSAVLIEQLDLPKDHGLVITEVRKNSAAEKGGLHSSDILLVFAGKKVPNDTMKFIELLDGISSDKEVDAIVLRKGKKETVSGIKLAEKVDQKAALEKAAGHYKIAVDAMGKGEGKGEGKGDGSKSEKANKSVSVTINNDEFKATEKDGESTMVVVGTVENKKVTVTNVSIEEPGFSAKYSSLDKVPSKYKARVEKLISNSGDSRIRFESRKD